MYVFKLFTAEVFKADVALIVNDLRTYATDTARDKQQHSYGKDGNSHYEHPVIIAPTQPQQHKAYD